MEDVTRIITKEPFWLSKSTQEIDRRLGFFQKYFNLNGDEVRLLTCRRPKLILRNLDDVKIKTFAFKEEMGFNDIEVKTILLDKPKLFMLDRNQLVEQFDYVHNVMKLSHDAILKHVMLLGNRKFRTEQRHSFLVSLGRAQYDPALPQYVSPSSLLLGDDLQFCTNVAKASVESFNLFLKTL
ncbi:transcription termination factor 3, mitochondrial isoform X2 [Nilaparvata lugens]|nr:transcription termination factor 3, mitochondrial isoform X2 [Nilaparvata lugens]